MLDVFVRFSEHDAFIVGMWMYVVSLGGTLISRCNSDSLQCVPKHQMGQHRRGPTTPTGLCPSRLLGQSSLGAARLCPNCHDETQQNLDIPNKSDNVWAPLAKLVNKTWFTFGLTFGRCTFLVLMGIFLKQLCLKGGPQLVGCEPTRSLIGLV